MMLHWSESLLTFPRTKSAKPDLFRNKAASAAATRPLPVGSTYTQTANTYSRIHCHLSLYHLRNIINKSVLLRLNFLLTSSFRPQHWRKAVNAFIAWEKQIKNKWNLLKTVRLALWDRGVSESLKSILIINQGYFLSSISLILDLLVVFHEAHSKLPWHVGQRETLLIHRDTSFAGHRDLNWYQRRAITAYSNTTFTKAAKDSLKPCFSTLVLLQDTWFGLMGHHQALRKPDNDPNSLSVHPNYKKHIFSI